MRHQHQTWRRAVQEITASRPIVASLVVVVVCALRCSCAVAQTQDPTRGVLRAIGPHISPEIVDFVARNGEPTPLPRTGFPDAESTPTRRIVEKLCGIVSPAYVKAAADINELEKLDLDAPMGSLARKFRWPPCLFAAVLPRSGISTVTVQRGDTAYDIYKRLTGGDGSPRAMERFFGESLSNLGELKPGRVLKVSAVTQPVSVVPLGLSVQAFTNGVLALDPAASMVRSPDPAPGDIVMGVPREGEITSGFACKPLLDEPFKPTHVKKAYEFAREQAGERDYVYPGLVEVVVVDNGFFGAKVMNDGSDAFAGSSFKKKWFKTSASAGIAATIESDPPLVPINYSYTTLKVTPTSGHGTHVAGLALGGYYFRDYRDTMKNGPWAQLTVLNVGKGERTLVRGVAGYLHRFLANPAASRVVNLSIAHDGAEKGTYIEILDGAPLTLFVTAAGNTPRSPFLTGAYPAALGGPGRPNIITVAALEGKDSLAESSGRGSGAVDIAAPGCQLVSWLDNTSQTYPMSGTSQAAPLVTFAVSLLRSLNKNATPAALKSRAIAGGDMLDAKDQPFTAYGVKLNIAKSMLWFDDYIELGGSEMGRYLGRLIRLDPVYCVGNGEIRSMPDMLAVKRDEAGRLHYFGGNLQDRPAIPCLANADASSTLSFRVTHRILDDGSIVKQDEREIQPALSDLKDMVRRSF